MDYDPFLRGPFPVGVRSALAVDGRREGRQLPFEAWYPATRQYRGLDLNPSSQDGFTVVPSSTALQQQAVRNAAAQSGRYPLLLFSHTSYGHRRQSSFLCTHLASHGYVVAAADHTGNTAVELAQRRAVGAARTQAELDAYIGQIIADRVPDLCVLADQLHTGNAGGLSDLIDDQRLGLIGWSFGGWAVLATLEADERFGAVVAMAPAGNSEPLPGIIPATLTFAWLREAPTLYLVAERDRSTPLPGMYELFQRTPAGKAMFILRHADHDHFGDRIEGELCPQEHAHRFTRGLALAHMDAALKDNRAAQRFMADDPIAAVRARGVDAVAYPDG